MSIQLPAHLFFRGTRIYWRRRLPKPLATVWGCQALVFSLGTTCREKSLYLGAVLDHHATKLFRRAAMTPSSSLPTLASVRADFAALRHVAEGGLRDMLSENDALLRRLGPHSGLSDDDHARIADAVLEMELRSCEDMRIRFRRTNRPLSDLAAMEDDLLADLRRAVAEGDCAPGEPVLRRALMRLGLPVPPEMDYLRLALQCIRLQIRALELERERRTTGYLEDAALRPGDILRDCAATRYLRGPFASFAPDTPPSPARSALPAPPPAQEVAAADLAAAIGAVGAPAVPSENASPEVARADAPVPEAAPEPAPAPTAPPQEQMAASAPLPGPLPGGALLSEVFKDYVADKVVSDWKGSADACKSQRDAQVALRLFVDLIGDRPVDTITREVAASFKFALRNLPRLHGKSVYTGMTASEAIAKRDEIDTLVEEDQDLSHLNTKSVEGLLEVLTPKTINKHLSFMCNFMDWRHQHSETDRRNPFSGLLYKKSKLKGKERFVRKAWTPEQMKTLFGSPAWTGHAGFRSVPGSQLIKDSFYWAPIIALLSGMRLEEILQLSVSDIRQTDGIWYFDIKAGHGQSLKSPAAVRRLPVHSYLITHGLLDHWESMKKRGQRWLFPETTPDKAGTSRSGAITKQFGIYRMGLGLDELGLDFHALRKTFNSDLQRQGVHTTVRSSLLGHEQKALADKEYSEGLELAQLQADVEKLTYVGCLPGSDGRGWYSRALNDAEPAMLQEA